MWALRSVAVVGARACTEYGAHMAATLAAGLAERGWVVVSGGAYGVDGAAHRGALGAGGATAAVLACGVDRPYPPGHTGLITRIAEQGLVVGELPPGDHPTPSRFILRNRVIAALTRGTVVVEAAYRSGSLVTARAAQRLGRHTMGVPGPATSALSAGVHELLRGDAVLVSDAAEVVELVGDMGELPPDRRGPVLPTDLLEPRTRQVLAGLPARGAAGSGRGGATRTDHAGRRDRETVRASSAWLRRTTRRRLEVDTPGDDLGPRWPEPVLTQRVRPSGEPRRPWEFWQLGYSSDHAERSPLPLESVQRNVSAYGPASFFAHRDCPVTLRSRGPPRRQQTGGLTQAHQHHGRTAQGDECPSTPPGPTGRRSPQPPATVAACDRPPLDARRAVAVVQGDGGRAAAGTADPALLAPREIRGGPGERGTAAQRRTGRLRLLGGVRTDRRDREVRRRPGDQVRDLRDHPDPGRDDRRAAGA